MACPLVCHFSISAVNDSQVRVEGMKLTDSFGTEAGGVMVHLGGVQKVDIRDFDHHSVVLISSQLSPRMCRRGILDFGFFGGPKCAVG